tara:strand:- start:3539 stop:4444 length:906 start_codon:yes stop_codon:yes gene_type:complete
MSEITRESILCYNYMTLEADHCLDHPLDYYKRAGCGRIHNKDVLDPLEVKKGDSVFVKTDYIFHGIFQKDILEQIKNPFILISGVSSYQPGANGDNSYLKILQDSRVMKWFCTNPPDIKSEKIVPIPIGFEEPEREGGNQEVLSHYNRKIHDFDKKENKLYLPYHTVGNNPSRDRFIRHLSSLDFVEVEENRLPFQEYLQKLEKFKYIICLEGAGYDTHRNYESLLVGSVPIMKTSTVKGVYDRNELPSVFVDDWLKVDESFFSHINSKTYDFKNVKNFMEIGYHMRDIEKTKERLMNDEG